MNLLITLLSKYKPSFFWACFNSILNKILDLMPPILVAWLVDTLSGQAPKFLSAAGQKTTYQIVALIIILTAVIFLLESLFEWLFNRSFKRIAQHIQHDVRLLVYDKVQCLPLSYFENNRLGNTLSILNDDINQLERFLNESFNEILQMVVLFIFAAIAFSSMSIELALVALAPIPLIVLGSIFYQRLIAPRYKKMRNTNGELNSRLENNISGIKVVKLFNAETYEYNRVDQISQTYREDNFKIIDINVAYIPLIRVFITAGFALGLLLASIWIIEGSDKISIGGIALYAMLIQRLLWPVTRLGRIFDDYERAMASVVRINGILSESDEPGKQGDVIKQNSFDRICFKNLSFSYNKETAILKNLNFEVLKGQSVGIVGATGAGKTTLVKLLTRLYDANEGDILIDDQSLYSLRLADWRSLISIVNQDAYLFHGSIRDNIAYGRDNIKNDEIIKAAQMAHLHEFIISLPNQYESLVGERGIKLSGGQRQRLSLARAILKDGPLLILDEATSAVDTKTEKAIQENIEHLKKDKTLVMIAHRLSTVKNTDKILVFDKGEIVESGKHEELLAINGIYNNLWSIQSGEKTN